MEGAWASVDGVVTPAAEARLSLLDNGVLFGDGVYETLRTYNGRPFHLGRHLRRLRDSARGLGIALPDDGRWYHDIASVLSRAGHRESYIRLMATRGVGDGTYRFERIAGPTLIVLVKPYVPPPDALYETGVGVIVSRVRRNPPECLDPALKSLNLLNNILAAQEAQARGAFEPLLLNLRDQVAEGASSNVFIVTRGILRTPPREAGILPGITRALVLELAGALGIPAEETPVWPADLHRAEEAFLTSTLKELMPVTRADGQVIGNGTPGPVTRRLLQAFRAHAAAAHDAPA